MKKGNLLALSFNFTVSLLFFPPPFFFFFPSTHPKIHQVSEIQERKEKSRKIEKRKRQKKEKERVNEEKCFHIRYSYIPIQAF